MKSNICVLTSDVVFSQEMLREVNKVAAYSDLDPKSSLRLTLLAEELIGMLPNFTDDLKGEFWVENEGSAYELHVKYAAEDRTLAGDDALLAISSSGKNAAAKGVVGKIRSLIDRMTLPEGGSFFRDYAIFSSGMIDYGAAYAHCWSLNRYALSVQDSEDSEEKAEAWDELEKSVITKLADDVLVGILGNQVEITVKKKF